MSDQPAANRIKALFHKLLAEAAEGGYHLNPDEEFTRELVESLIVNIDRYGYPACPCRLAAGKREDDLDIICPCDYRDPDLNDFGACFCALYVSEEIASGNKEAKPIPERRSPKGAKSTGSPSLPPSLSPSPGSSDPLAYPVWRCKVCGYLCAREHPPGKCPVCKADKDRFERFL